MSIKRIKGTLNNYYWEDRCSPPSGRCILLYNKDLDIYIGVIHIGMRSRNLNLSKVRHYVNIYIGPNISSEFISEDLDVAKLKAEVEADRLLKIAGDEDVELCRLGRENNSK